jgi:hypothetical protein
MDTPPSPSHPLDTIQPRNANTRLPVELMDRSDDLPHVDAGFDAAPRLAPETLFAAYETARARLATVPAQAPGFRLFWARGREMGWLDLSRGGGHAVVGRHDRCDLVLPDDPELSLRHLIATPVSLSDGVALRMLDLRTRVPFYLDDPTPRRSLVASGPVVVRLGRYCVGAWPIEPGIDGVLRVEAPERPRSIVVESPSLPASAAPSPPSAPSVPRITVMPHSIPIVEVAGARSRQPYRQAAPVTGPRWRATEQPCAIVTLSGAGGCATVELTQAELERGVLIGRHERCHGDPLRTVLDTNISRGHLVLLRQHDGTEAFDLSSTQGTYVERRAVRRIRLENGATLVLSTGRPVTLEWRQV